MNSTHPLEGLRGVDRGLRIAECGLWWNVECGMLNEGGTRGLWTVDCGLELSLRLAQRFNAPFECRDCLVGNLFLMSSWYVVRSS